MRTRATHQAVISHPLRLLALDKQAVGEMPKPAEGRYRALPDPATLLGRTVRFA